MILTVGALMLAFQAAPLSDAEIEALANRLSTVPQTPSFKQNYLTGVSEPVTAPQRPTPSMARRSSTYDYVYCVQDAVARLDASGEPATTVVDAAATECRSMMSGPAEPGSVLSNLPPERYQSLMGEFRTMVSNKVRARLVAVRACRNTPGCDVQTVAPAFNDLPPRGQ